MLGIKRVVAGLLVGGGAVYFADHYHLVHTTEGVVVVPRAQQALLRSAYADVRGWDQTKWDQYPELTESLAKDGRGGFLLEGTMSGLLQQAGSALGVTPSATSTGVTTPERPPIVFESPLGPTLPNAAAHPGAAMQSATDDSLLGRLSRQLQATSATTSSSPTLPDRTQIQPNAPAATAPPGPYGETPRLDGGRAGLSNEQLPEDLYPSIHSAAMQRITPEIARPVEGLQQQFESVRGKWPEGDALPQPVHSAAELFNGGARSPTLDRATVPPTSPASTAGETGYIPLPIEGERLRERLPTTMQDTLRMLTPLTGPSAQRPTVSSF